MKTFLLSVALLALGLAVGFGWAGLICFNTGDTDYTEHFWGFGFIAFLVCFIAICGFAATATVSE